MMRVLRSILLAVLGAVLVAFAVANRADVRFVLDPLSGVDGAWSVEMPLYGLLFAALLSGFVLGAVFAWNGQRKWRRAARQRGAEAHELRRETERLTRQVRVMERARNAAAPPVRGYGQQGLIH